ncbi:hypothetical protein [Mucilaginibacter flavidus]|uniref:hypothetical protein n=1 Tax=Mucilaginibacter flavidus TaxID=2949309 RepID=UPI002093EB89|nr:hypothetical protein [Mucilaginibacter flavidus]MCO5950560.1 hypothetical protein [Mucilaginibacter flavidus]
MTRIVAISLLLVQLFNIGGSLALREFLVFKSNLFFNSQTSKGLYNVKDLTEIKLPVQMNVSADWPEYENVSGVIQFEDISYNYVKMKVTRDAIYLMCVPNYQTTRLNDGNVLNVKGVKNVPVPKKEHVPPVKFVLQVNSFIPFTQVAFESPVKILTHPAPQRAQALIYQNTDIPEQPPRLAC